MIKDKGIKKVHWLVNCQNLHPIKDIWNWEKEILSSKQNKLRGAEKRV